MQINNAFLIDAVECKKKQNNKRSDPKLAIEIMFALTFQQISPFVWILRHSRQWHTAPLSFVDAILGNTVSPLRAMYAHVHGSKHFDSDSFQIIQRHWWTCDHYDILVIESISMFRICLPSSHSPHPFHWSRHFLRRPSQLQLLCIRLSENNNRFIYDSVHILSVGNLVKSKLSQGVQLL